MSEKKQAFSVELHDTDHYQSLFKKDGQLLTCGMHSGRVFLHPGQECGLHNTEDKEEMLVFLTGSGIAEVENQQPIEVGVGKVLYMPPRTDHNIKNTGQEPLSYVFCVVPVK
jgi:mannose-6-phosphate isomerase-like protein (cupin superfamily)